MVAVEQVDRLGDTQVCSQVEAGHMELWGEGERGGERGREGGREGGGKEGGRVGKKEGERRRGR